jgi:L-threonylcarbamoyladenylate synthase
MTQLLTEKQIDIGVRIIKDGGLVAFQTETVYGLAGDASNKSAVQKIFEAKNRPIEKQLVLQFASIKDVCAHFPNDVDEVSLKLLKKFRVGLTVVLPNGTAVRIPANPFAKKFLRACGIPLVVTSANTSAQPSTTTWNAVYDDLNGRIDAIFMSKPSKVGTPSTIVKIENGEIKILRQGAIPARKLKDTLR